METLSVNYRNVIINSTTLMVIASILEITLHEFGHLLASLIVGAQEVKLFHHSISNNIDGLVTSEIIFINAAGPNISLLIGLVFNYYCFVSTSRNMNFLFCVYMSVFGYIGCFGPMMATPFFTYSDTGYIAYVLNFQPWLTFLIAILSAVFLFFMMKHLTKYFVAMGTFEHIENPHSRVKFINALMVYPLIFGVAIIALLCLPVSNLFSLIAPICSPFIILWTYGYARQKMYKSLSFNSNIHTIDVLNILWMIVLVLVVIMNRMLSIGLLFN